MCSTPVSLSYCEPGPFPFSSEMPADRATSASSADGLTTVAVGGDGEPPLQIRWAAVMETGLRTAPLVALGLMAAAGLFGILLQCDQLDRPARLAAGFGFGLFSIGVAILTWKTRYDILLELLAHGRKKRSVFQISADRLIVRTAGERTIWIPRQMLREIEIEPAPTARRGASALLDPRLLLIQADGQIVHLMPAATDAELRAVATLIRRAYEL